MLEILQAPPFATIQDLGRVGHRHEGVPPAGAMDPGALQWLNRRLGNPGGHAAVEWALGAGVFRFHQSVTIAVGPATGSIGGTRVPAWTPVACPPGTELAVDLPGTTRFGYLAIAGGVAVTPVLGSRSTYLPGGFGGMDGRRLRTGDRLPLGEALATASRAGETPPRYDAMVRLLPGPQAHLFDETAWAALLGNRYAIGSASDRMGYRLEGPTLRHAGPAALPSEAACPGAVQVPDGGAPIVLMPDGPTVGGYPKIAVVLSADLGKLAELRPGDRPGFQLVTLDDARSGSGSAR